MKCPVSCEKLPIADFETRTANVKYIYFSNDNVELQQSHVYYTQCQVQLYVTGLMECDLYVWSPKGSCAVSVHRNEDFLKVLIPKLETFYFKHFLKVLAGFPNENNNNNNI